MTSISSAGLTPSAFTSPRDLLQNELQSEVSSGAISADDQSALSSALDDIHSALKSERESDQASGAGRPTHEQMQSKINDLIANEVQNGTLTSDQADELKNVFAKAFSHGADGAGGPGGPGGPGGSSGQGGQGDACAPGGAGDASASSSSSSSSSDQLNQVLSDFLKSVQQSLSQTQNPTYDSSGDTGSVSIAALVVNYQA
jgi:hypothetical protein